MQDKLNTLAALIRQDTLDDYNQCYPGSPFAERNAEVTIKPGPKYVKVDVGTSGKYMVDAEGNIFGIKGYGVIHRGHRYGTLDTINDYYWGGYVAVKKSQRQVYNLPSGTVVIKEVRS